VIWETSAFVVAQIPLLLVILWLLNQLTKAQAATKEYAELLGQIAGHDIIQAKEYVRAMSERAADAEVRADNIAGRRTHHSTMEMEEGVGP